jgi:hypothetical protein
MRNGTMAEVTMRHGCVRVDLQQPLHRVLDKGTGHGSLAGDAAVHDKDVTHSILQLLTDDAVASRSIAQ